MDVSGGDGRSSRFRRCPDPPMQVELPDAGWTAAWRAASFQLQGPHMWGGLAFEVGRVAHEMDMIGLHAEADKVYRALPEVAGREVRRRLFRRPRRAGMGDRHATRHGLQPRRHARLDRQAAVRHGRSLFPDRRQGVVPAEPRPNAGGGRLDHPPADRLHERRAQPKRTCTWPD